MTVLIDTATDVDAGPCLALYQRVLAEGRWFITSADEFSGTVEKQAKRIRSMNASENSRFLVARQGQQVVGVVSVEGGQLARMNHVGRLEMYVDAAARGQGVGRCLLEAAIAWAESNPLLCKLGLTVFEDNDRAVALYEHFGFEREGRRVGEYRERNGNLRNDLLFCRAV